jgi:hypothetical protein
MIGLCVDSCVGHGRLADPERYYRSAKLRLRDACHLQAERASPHIVTSIGKLTRSAANAASRTLNEAGAE